MRQKRPVKLVVFRLGEQKFALHLSSVEGVVSSVKIKSLKIAPHYVVGTAYIQGELLPVISIRILFNYPLKNIEPTDRFIVVRATNMRMVLCVDSADEIATISEDEIERSRNIVDDSKYMEGIFKLRSGMVMINNLDKFLTHQQITGLSREMAKQIVGN